MFFVNNFITLKPMYEIAEKTITVKGTSVYQNYIDGTAENGNKRHKNIISIEFNVNVFSS